ncbi:MAG: hypothetical protein JNL71_02065 [Rhodospirillales bacterium]|nr:hypothetical protein [Rhodospirillales bacterium]
MALPPITATTTLPGYARPVPVSQPAPAPVAARGGTNAGASIGGGAASSAIANQAKQALLEASKSTAAGEPATDSNNKPRAQLPSPPFSQNVGLYVNSTRVFVDIVLSGDENRRVARVFGTPPAPPPPGGRTGATRDPVNFVA